MIDIVERANTALEGVTEGPWEIEEVSDWDGYNVFLDDGGPGTAYICEDFHQGENGRADAKFVASARVLVPGLVAEVERLRAVVKAVPSAIQQYATDEGTAISETGTIGDIASLKKLSRYDTALSILDYAFTHAAVTP